MSTPEILERVYTLESEILQIEEAIAIQGNHSIGISLVSKYIYFFGSKEPSSKIHTH